jgi:transcriptional regulator with XRE-family HTH domain
MGRAAGFFGRKLRALRKAAGLSVYRLAQSSGMTLPSVSNLEKGINQPSWDTVQRLVAVLGVPFDEFADPALRTPQGPPPGKPGRPRKKRDEAAEGGGR